MKRYLKLALIVALPLAAMGADKKFTSTVLSVSDGDTITVKYKDKSVRVHLYALECPHEEQTFHQQAKQFTFNNAYRKTVTVKIIRKEIIRGEIFIIGEVILPDGRNLGHELIKAGLAWYYEQYAPHEGKMLQLQQKARKERRGLWQENKPIAPWDYRLNHPRILTTRKARYTGGFCASKKSRIYHPCTCPKVGNIAHEDFIKFASKKEARKSGRVQCRDRQKKP